MDQEAKTSFSFASIAVSFFILIVLPLTITGVIISKGVVRVGEEATQANLRVLDDNQKLSIGARAQAVADAVAQFLSDVEKDIRIASILPRDEKSYATFLKSNTRGVVQPSKMGVVGVPVPVYDEIAFLNREGRVVLKLTADGTAVAAVGESNIKAIGALLYGRYLFLFEAAGLILLVAMVGAIVLTHRQRTGVRGQNVSKQNARRPDEATVNVKPEVGKGVTL